MLCLVTMCPYQNVRVGMMPSFPFSQGGNSFPRLYLNLQNGKKIRKLLQFEKIMRTRI